MLGDIYYFLGVFIVLKYLFVFSNYTNVYKFTEWLYKYKKVTGSFPTIKDFRKKEDVNTFNNLMFFIFFDIIENIWMLFGFLTKSWYVFLFLFFTNFIFKKIIKSILFTRIGFFINIKFMLFNLLIIIYLIINHFHLHYDTIDFFI